MVVYRGNDRGLIWGMRSLLVRKTGEGHARHREWSKQRQEILGNAFDEAGCRVARE